MSAVVLLSNDVEATLGAARELKSHGIRFYVLEPVNSVELRKSKYLTAEQLLASHEQPYDVLNQLARHETIAVVALSDWALELLVKASSRLNDAILMSPFLRDNPNAGIFDKLEFYSRCRVPSLAVPDWYSFADGFPGEDWFRHGAGYVIKPRLKRSQGLDLDGKAIYVQDRAEALSLFESIQPDYRSGWLIQERIDAPATETRQLDLSMRLNGYVTFRCITRSAMNAANGLGEAARLDICDPIPVEQALIDWLRSIGYCGGINAEFMYEHSTRRYRLFDLNIRPPGHYGFTHAIGGRMILDGLRDCGFLDDPDSEYANGHRPTSGTMVRPASVLRSNAPTGIKIKAIGKVVRSLLAPSDDHITYAPMYSRDDRMILPQVWAYLKRCLGNGQLGNKS